MTSALQSFHPLYGVTYQIVEDFRTWAEAAAAAVQQGGFLVQIDDAEEQNAVYDAILQSGISSTYTVVNDGGGIAYIWIGTSDNNQEGNWIWDGNNDSQGTLFWTGQGAAGANNGMPINGLYNNWGGTSQGAANEPDDFQANQDAAAIALASYPNGAPFTLGTAGESIERRGLSCSR